MRKQGSVNRNNREKKVKVFTDGTEVKIEINTKKTQKFLAKL